MFGAIDDDDLEFNPAAGSKLASLFNLEKSPEKGNASLTYTAPKQPRQHANDEGSHSSKRSAPAANASTSASNKLSLIIAKAVTSFKLEDGRYNPQGKFGVALLGNHVSCLFQLLLYKGKQQQITTVRISPNFQFTVQPHLYASFYDDRSQNWSIMFENKEDALEFTTQVAVARYRCAGPNEESIISQELLPGSGDCFKQDEAVLLKLSAQPFTTDSVQAVDLQQAVIECTLSHKLGNSGWSAGLMGASSGSVRVILVPLSIQVPWLTSKRNEPLLIRADISSIKSTNVDNAEKSPPSKQKLRKGSAPASSVDSPVDSSAEDTTVRARGASIKEALSNSPRSNKASIISRMARMGQATLPLKGAIPCNPSDSEETEEDSGTHRSTNPSLKARPAKTRTVSTTLQQQAGPFESSMQSSPAAAGVAPAAMTLMQTPVHWNQHQQNMMRTGNDGSMVQIVTSEGQLVSLSSPQQLPLVSATSALMSPSDPSPHMSMFMSEARIQNTEVRMHLSKFNDKMDQLMTKVDNLHPSSGPSSAANMSAVGLEPNVLLSSIEKIVKDNQTLQMEVAEKNKRLDEQNERIFSLLNTNSKFLEQSNCLLEQKQLQEQNLKKEEEQQHQQEQQLQLLQQLREEKLSLGNQLASLQNQLASVQELVQALQKSNSELNQELEATRNRLQEKENTIRECGVSGQNFGMEDQLTQLSQALEIQKSKNSQFQDQIAKERGNFEAEKRSADERYKNLEQQHMADIDKIKVQLRNKSEHYTQVVGDLEQLKKKLQEEPKQTEGSASLADNLIMDVKLLMNTLHKGLNKQFTLGQSYDAVQIRTMISSIVKREALQFVDKMEKQHFTQNNRSNFNKKKEDPLQESLIPKTAVVKDSQKQEEGDGPTGNASSSTLLAGRIEESDLKPLNVSEVGTEPEKVISHTSESSGPLSDVSKDMNVSFEGSWRPLPPPPPLFHDDDDSDDWLT